MAYEKLTPDMIDGFLAAFDAVQEVVHANAVAKGFWALDRNFGEAIALIHSEVSEALEGHRMGNPPDDKLPQFDSVTVELADIIIRIMDMAEGEGFDLSKALLAKIQFNDSREPMHGKKY